MAAEPTLYSDKRGVHITSTRASFGATTYSIADITSVARGEEPPRRIPGVVLAVLSLIVLPACVAFGSIEGIIICFMVLVVGIIIAAIAKPIHHLKITTASGEVTVASSEDKQYINRLITALNEVLSRHG